jgi:mRNA interferase HigB
VRVIARGTLTDFVRNRASARHRAAVKAQLDAWYAEVSRAEWKSPAELKRQYRSASVVSAERVVFNIKDNDYRLVVAISYEFQLVLIKWLGTHEEYDRIDVEQVTYDEDRYSNATH